MPLLGLTWDSGFAIVGSLAAVAVAVFTGLAYRYGLKEGRERRVTEERRRQTLLLAVQQMDKLTSGLLSMNSPEEFRVWIVDTADLIDRGLPGLLHAFMDAASVPFEVRVDPPARVRQETLNKCRRLLMEWMNRAETLPVDPAFDPAAWTPPSGETG